MGNNDDDDCDGSTECQGVDPRTATNFAYLRTRYPPLLHILDALAAFVCQFAYEDTEICLNCEKFARRHGNLSGSKHP